MPPREDNLQDDLDRVAPNHSVKVILKPEV